MNNPFKRQHVTLKEIAEQSPPAPCGEQFKHYEWATAGLLCPMCWADEQRRKRDEDERRMAGLIADAVVARMKEAA